VLHIDLMRPLRPSRQEVADYAACLLHGLSDIAEGSGMARLAELLRAAEIEAKRERAAAAAEARKRTPLRRRG
jgi:hypothetical protein